MGDARIARHLGRVLSAWGEAAGTCFQIAPGYVVTACHILEKLGCDRPGDLVSTDALNGSVTACATEVLAVDEAHDLAVLRRDEPLPGPVPRLVPTDTFALLTDVVVTGVSEVEDEEGHEYRHLDATGVWQGGTVRGSGVALGRLTSTSLMPGMSGAPVLRLSDGAVAGVVSGRYNSTDGWLRDSVWVARTEDLADLLRTVGGLALVRRIVLVAGEPETVLWAAPSGETAPSGQAAVSGAVTPSGAAVPSGQVAPSGAAVPSGQVAPSGAAVPSGQVALSGAEVPSGRAAVSGEDPPSLPPGPVYGRPLLSAPGPPPPGTQGNGGGPREAALEAARVLTALDDACRGAGRLGPLVEDLIRKAGADDPDGVPVRDFRARLHARGLDPRVLLRSTTGHQEALRRWAGPLGGAADEAEESASGQLLASFRRVLADEVRGPLFAELADTGRRNLAAALTDGHTLPLSAFLRALEAQLPPLRSTSTEAVLARTLTGDDSSGNRPQEGAGPSSGASGTTGPSASSIPPRAATASYYHRAELSALAAQMTRLPDPDPYVAGRDRLVAEVVRKVDRRMGRRAKATAFLSGQPGVGTSTVAVEAARALAPAFPGGVCYVDLAGLVPEARKHPRDVVRRVSEALGLDLGGGTRGDAHLFEAFTAALRDRGVLLVLDNALDAEHVAPLVKVPATCGAIVTSRDSVQGYADPGLVFRVAPLDRAASIEVLTGWDEDRDPGTTGAEHETLDRIADLCADVPMALRMVAARMAGRPDLSPDHLLQLLERETTRLDYLDAGDRAVRAAIGLSYDILGPDVARTFRFIAAAPGFALTGPEAGHCLDTPAYDQEKLLNRLVDRSLAGQRAVRSFDGRLLATFSLFDLVLLFAKERLAQEEPEEDVHDFQHRSVTYLRDRLTEVNDQRRDADLSGELDPTRFHSALHLAEHHRWLDLATDLAVGLHVLYSARGELDAVLDVNGTRVDLHLRHGQPEEAVKACLLNADTLAESAAEAALESARRAGEIAREHALTAWAAEADFKVSLLLWEGEDLPAALVAAERAADVLIAMGREARAVPVAINACLLARETGDTARALRWGRTATDLAERWADTETRASAFFERARAEFAASRMFDAIASNRRAEDLYKAVEDWTNAAVSCRNAAWAASSVNDSATAVEMLGRAADHWERHGSAPHVMETLVDLAALQMTNDTLEQAGHALARARRAAESASVPAEAALLHAEVLLRDAAMLLFLPDTAQAERAVLRLPTLPSPGGAGGTDPTADDAELRRVRDVLRRHHDGALSAAEARRQTRSFLSRRTRNGPPPFKLWLHKEFGAEHPARASLGPG
ncbi:trypsin-like peptidase domain-containing protein [Streptomyces sp. NPDC013455]|uniref:trypsin-like peptidase domain-containing protein n=1 Tax=Streptomyces sp. NPDC013455 TaxID=3155605 RepID=UPI0033EF566B